VLVIGQRQYSSYQQHADSEANHKGSHGYQGHPKEEAPAPYEESIRHKETTKEKIAARHQLRWGTCSTHLCRIRLIRNTRIPESWCCYKARTHKVASGRIRVSESNPSRMLDE
jgi:hypothetical protein